MGLTMKVKRAIAAEAATRYQKARKKEKQVLLVVQRRIESVLRYIDDVILGVDCQVPAFAKLVGWRIHVWNRVHGRYGLIGVRQACLDDFSIRAAVAEENRIDNKAESGSRVGG